MAPEKPPQERRIKNMLFSEIYGNYYNTIAAILDEALKDNVTSEEVRSIAAKKAFAESTLTITDELSHKGRWPLIDKDGRALTKKETHMPLTTLQKRWLKAVLLDKRIQLFDVDDSGLEEVEPLFKPEDIVYYDQFDDGDNYEDEAYVRIFKMLLKAVSEHISVKILYTRKDGLQKWTLCNPVRIEYSLRDDKFRMISRVKSVTDIFNIEKIKDCEYCGAYEEGTITSDVYNKKSVELILRDDKQALERFMLQFSIYEKVTEKLSDNMYRCVLTYEADDETDILIKVLSFGTNLKVETPQSFIRQIKKRIKMQKQLSSQLFFQD